MAAIVPLDDLTDACQKFADAVGSVPDPLFLKPMSPGGWSARDTVAHLTGWNREMIAAGRDILDGKTPAYYAESGIDYRDLNAGFVARYASPGKAGLLAELTGSMAELEAFARGLDPAELTADHGVMHYRDGAATVARALTSLAGDYRYHAEEIAVWLATTG